MEHREPDPFPRDPVTTRILCALVERVLVPYHRAEVRGLERLPPGPALCVGNHSGGTYTGDTWIAGAAVWRAHGLDAMPFGLAHEIVMRAPGVGRFLRSIGAVPANHGNAERVLRAGRKLLVYPGGDLDAMRPWRHRGRVIFGGRQGFARLALREGVPIVPVVAAGAHETFIVIDDLRWLARALRIDRRFRLKVLPLSFVLPWGLVLGPPPPYLPLPTRMIIEVLPPIHFERSGPDAAEDAEYVAECAARVEGVLQAALTRLEAERRRG